ncbi:MAG: DUF975 family protein [Prevotellaceae bacterium]|jgi:uncharacterized membrane protein|nr:DUF975 family protein [Prevotellaceae bacterium]
MATPNKILMAQARESLSGHWGLAVGTYFLYFLIMGATGAIHNAGSIITLLVGGAFTLGITTFALAIARKEEAKLEMIFSGFKYYGKTLGLYLLITLFVLLWMLLLIVPGIIAAISYGLAFYLMSDSPNIGVMEAIDKSKKMMYGYKWKYFCLGLRFIGWAILGILSLGIGFLWICPYISISYAKFYEDVKANYVEEVQ